MMMITIMMMIMMITGDLCVTHTTTRESEGSDAGTQC